MTRLIYQNDNLCGDKCPLKVYYNFHKADPFMGISSFIEKFHVPFETSIHHCLSEVKVLFIGEAPGEKEALYKRPFYEKAPSGKILRFLIQELGLKFYAIANVVCCRPIEIKGNYFYNRTPTTNECIYCLQHLRQFILSLSKDLTIILLGKTSAFTVLKDAEYIQGYNTITSLVKLKPLKFNGRIFGANFHPRYIASNGGIGGYKYIDWRNKMEEIINVQKELHSCSKGIKS